jgi:hypothetical protein
MAHFAEIDSNNKVIRVLVACNQDIANNGGELSEQAAKAFEKVIPLSENGIKWVQTSYHNNFRKQFASKNYTYDSTKDIFIKPKPFASWSLDGNNDWQAPISYPVTYTLSTSYPDSYLWNEETQTWDIEQIEEIV